MVETPLPSVQQALFQIKTVSYVPLEYIYFMLYIKTVDDGLDMWKGEKKMRHWQGLEELRCLAEDHQADL